MASREHTYQSSFFWNSTLTAGRKVEIIDWVKSLSDEDADKLTDLLRDVRQDQQFHDDMEGDLF